MVKATLKSDIIMSWGEIAEEINAGNSKGLFAVNDTVTFIGRDGNVYSAEVLAIDLYEPDSIIFGFKNAFKDFQMNERDINAGGYCESQLAPKMEEHLTTIIPYNLMDKISPRTIIQNINGETFESSHTFWLPSIVELFGEDYRRYECEEGVIQFEGFKKCINRIKIRDDRLVYVWSRSPNPGGTNNFWFCTDTGAAGGINGANRWNGVSPCFLIKKTRALRKLHNYGSIEDII
jgi:hypothetical protein